MAQIDLAVCDCEDVDEIDPTRAWPPRGSELAAVRETDLHVGNSKASRPGCTVVPGTRRTSGPSLASSDMKISLLLRRHASQLREHGTTAHTRDNERVGVSGTRRMDMRACEKHTLTRSKDTEASRYAELVGGVRVQPMPPGEQGLGER